MCCRNGSPSTANTRTTGWLSEKLTSRRSAPPTAEELTKRSDSFRVADHPERDPASQYKRVSLYLSGKPSHNQDSWTAEHPTSRGCSLRGAIQRVPSS